MNCCNRKATHIFSIGAHDIEREEGKSNDKSCSFLHILSRTMFRWNLWDFIYFFVLNENCSGMESNFSFGHWSGMLWNVSLSSSSATIAFGSQRCWKMSVALLGGTLMILIEMLSPLKCHGMWLCRDVIGLSSRLPLNSNSYSANIGTTTRELP